MNMKRYVTLFGLLALALPTPAGTLLFDSMPTEGLPGFSTYTISIEAAEGEVFRGVDATFEGPMNQQLAAGMPLVFESFVAWDQSRDSHFLFSSGDLLSINARESDELLGAVLSGMQGLSPQNPRPFVQIVTANPSAVSYDLSFDLGGADPVNFQGFLVPEPASAWMVVSLVALSVTRRRGRDTF